MYMLICIYYMKSNRYWTVQRKGNKKKKVYILTGMGGTRLHHYYIDALNNVNVKLVTHHNFLKVQYSTYSVQPTEPV